MHNTPTTRTYVQLEEIAFLCSPHEWPGHASRLHTQRLWILVRIENAIFFLHRMFVVYMCVYVLVVLADASCVWISRMHFRGFRAVIFFEFSRAGLFGPHVCFV